jgi:hypothetical protein
MKFLVSFHSLTRRHQMSCIANRGDPSVGRTPVRVIRHPLLDGFRRHDTDLSNLVHVVLTLSHSILENYYDGPAHDAEVYSISKKLRDQLVQTSGFDSLITYINYAHGDEGPEVWYGKDNLPRLVQLKKKWDPEGNFGAGNPVPRS